MKINWFSVFGFFLVCNSLLIPVIPLIGYVSNVFSMKKENEKIVTKVEYDYDGDGRIELEEPEKNKEEPKKSEFKVNSAQIYKVERKIEKIIYRIFKVGETEQKLTCYSKLDGGIEAKGVYANESIDLCADRLLYNERRIRGNHYTVAVNYEMKQYHEKLININGVWTHKYRFHVPNYNSDIMPDKSIDRFAPRESSNWYLMFFNSPYFSAPRDRMGCHTKRNSNGQIITRDKYSFEDRMDVLFTSAGNFASIRDRQCGWMRNTPPKVNVEMWEICKLVVYNDGTEEIVE